MTNYPIQIDLQGANYQALIDFLGLHASYVLLVSHEGEASAKCRETLRWLQDFGETVDQVREWPGTRLHGGGSAFTHRFPVNGESLEFVKGRVNSLFAWRWPEQPEDLCFLSSEGIPLLTTIAHEAYAELVVNNDIEIPLELEEILIDASHRRKSGVIVTVPSQCNCIHRRYVGIEGNAWPVPLPTIPALSFGIARDVEASLSYWRTLRTIPDFSDAVCLYVNDETCPRGFEFVGFDCGYYDNEYDSFSLILHELLLARNCRGANFTSKLNALGLFNKREDAVGFMHTVLEDDISQSEYGGCIEELSVIKVFAYVTACPASQNEIIHFE